MKGEGYLTRYDLEAVIRRAAELEAQTGSSAPDLSEGDLVRIAQEVGLSEESVRVALAEHRATASGGDLVKDRGWVSRACGPGLVSATRLIPRAASEVRRELEDHLDANESLRLVRRTHAASLWQPDRGVLASVVRSVDLFGRGYELAKKSRAVEVRVVSLGESSCQVTLTADVGNQRSEWFWGLGFAVGGSAAAGAGAGAALLAGDPLLAAAGAPLLALFIWLARVGFLKALDKMQLGLEGMLDRLEHDEPLEPPRPSWRDLLK